RIVPATEQEATVPRAAWHQGQTDEALLKKLLQEHNRWTGSKRARELLDHWSAARSQFVKVLPTEYRRALAQMHERQLRQERAASAPDAQQRQAALAQ
ncbi:hypothetical protein ET532_011155, partial [Verminephrobacter sp. Larva24]